MSNRFIEEVILSDFSVLFSFFVLKPEQERSFLKDLSYILTFLRMPWKRYNPESSDQILYFPL